MADLRFPIGKYSPPETITEEHVAGWIEDIKQYPQTIRSLVEGMTEEQLNTPYRPDGWTVRQVVHHTSESHLNSIIRFKWGLTEDEPKIKAYNQTEWAETADVNETPIELTLDFLDLLHAKWVLLLSSIKGDQWKRGILHPETGTRMQLDWLAGMYAWHGKHHAAHVSGLIEREGWG